MAKGGILMKSHFYHITTLFFGLFLVAANAAKAQQMGPTTEPDPRASYDCDGTDLWLFEEIETSGWVGFGETWDFESCGFGQNIYFEGTRRVWRDMRLSATTADHGAEGF